MATVNRFFRPNRIAEVNPVPLEQLALVPQYMRQQHDAVAGEAFKNTILNADTLASDAKIAEQALAPIEQQSQQLIDDLAKNGFSQEKKSDLMKLLGTKKQVQRDVIQPLEARKQSYLQSVEEIKKTLKEDPELMRNRLAQLDLLNQQGAAIDPDTGKLKVPGIQNPLYAKRMSTKDIQDAYKQAGDMVAEQIKEIYLGPEQRAAVNKGADLWAVLEKQTLTSKQQEEIESMMRNTIGSDILNSMKMDIAVQMGGMADDMSIEQFLQQTNNPQVANRFTQELGETVLNRKKASIVRSEAFNQITNPEGKREYLQKELANYKNSQTFEADFNNLREQAQNKTALDFLTDISVEDKFKNISEAMAYANMELDRKYMAMDATESARAKSEEDGSNLLMPTMPGGRVSTNSLAPFYDTALNPEFSEIKVRTQANKNLYKKFAEEEGYFIHEKVDKNGNNIIKVTKDAEGKTPLQAHEMNKFAETYNIEDEVNAIKNPETNKELQEFISKDPRLEEVKNTKGSRAALEKINSFYKNLGQQYGDVTVFQESTREQFKNIYDNSLNKIAYTLEDGRTVDIEEFLDYLDLDHTSEIKEKGYSVSGNRNVFGMGNAIEANFINSDGEDVTVYLEPPREFNQNLLEVQPISSAVDKAIVEMGKTKQPFKKLDIPDTKYTDSKGRVTPVYYTVVPDYDTGEVLLYGSTNPDLDMTQYVGRENTIPKENTGIYSLSEVISVEKEYADEVIQDYTLQDKEDK